MKLLSMEQLNLSQRKVALSEDKLALVASTPASGKTATLTTRIKYLMEKYPFDKIVALTFTNNAAEEMRGRVGVINDNIVISTLHSYCLSLLTKKNIETAFLQKSIQEENFDQILQIMLAHPEAGEDINWLLIDEAQDCCKADFQIIEQCLKPQHLMIIGDSRQCQPAGTQVLLKDGSTKSIENIEVGDCVITCRTGHDSAMAMGGTAPNAKDWRVLEKEGHMTDEELITITTSEGLQSTYTPNHRCIINMRNYEYNYLVYLMEKEKRFRVGISQLRNTAENPWRSKMRAEGADKIWILKLFKTSKEAKVLEDRISYFYQIPQLTWQLDKTTYTQEDIDYVYQDLDIFSNGKKCLEAFHRMYEHPFVEKDDNNHYASNAWNECYACNLLPEAMDVKVFDKTKKHRFHSETITNINYSGKGKEKMVYSLKIETHETYFADGILTHNSIYGFRGASPQDFENYRYNPNTTVYCLNENYRNSPEIFEFSKQFLDDYYDEEVAKVILHKREGGYVDQISSTAWQLPSKLKLWGWEEDWKNWAILTRTNRDLNDVRQALMENNIPSVSFKQGDLSNNEIKQAMESNKVKVLTVHSSKGLEFDRVIVFGLATSPSLNEEERHLQYVAATRAKNELYWCRKTKNYKKRKKPSFHRGTTFGEVF